MSGTDIAYAAARCVRDEGHPWYAPLSPYASDLKQSSTCILTEYGLYDTALSPYSDATRSPILTLYGSALSVFGSDLRSPVLTQYAAPLCA
eukprot:3309487-Rhodomonas_salina.1